MKSVVPKLNNELMNLLGGVTKFNVEIRVNDKEVQVFDFDSINKSATAKRKERLKKEEKERLYNKLGLKQAPNNYVYVDTKNELLWNNNMSKKRYLSWKQANAYCKQLDLQGINTWRMPFIKELKHLLIKEILII